MRGRKRVGASVEVWMSVVIPMGGQPGGITRIEKAMTARGLGKLNLAQRAGCSNATIHKLLKGEMKTCSPSLAVAVTQAVGLDLWDVFVPRSSITAGQTPLRKAA